MMFKGDRRRAARGRCAACLVALAAAGCVAGASEGPGAVDGPGFEAVATFSQQLRDARMGLSTARSELDRAIEAIARGKADSATEEEQVRTNQCCNACGISKYEFLRSHSSLADWESHLDANDPRRQGRCTPEKMGQVREKWTRELDAREAARAQAATAVEAARARLAQMGD
jgi:hypothetical protein